MWQPKRMVSYAADTHCGNVRKLNEDCYEADPELGLWLVADGVGGHASGDVASQLTRETIKNVYRQSGDLVSAIKSAHRVVLDAIAQKAGGSNMGSTVVAATLSGRDYQIAWVGDSRAYVWDGALRLLSKDHSFVEALVSTVVFSHPLFSELAVFNLFKLSLHALFNRSIDNFWSYGYVTPLCSFRDREAHSSDSRFDHEVNDKLKLV